MVNLIIYLCDELYLKHSPWRILEDAGGALAMGAIGGSLWNGIKGFKNSPKVRRPHIVVHLIDENG